MRILMGLAAVLLSVGHVAVPSAALAEIAPVAEDDAWGFDGLIDSDFNNFDATVWAIEQIGSRVYVGGRFTEVVSGPGGRTEDRYALAAFDAVTGALLTDFAPDIRGGAVYAIEATPNGRLFVGGEFTSVGGTANTAGLAEIDPRTGDLSPTWRTGLERPWSVLRPSARAIAFHGDDLYVAGNFSHASNRTQRVRLNRTARISLSTGRIDPAFNPLVSGGSVWDLAISPDASRVYLAGSFSSVNGDAANGDRFAAINSADGSLVAGVVPFTPNYDGTGRQYAVEAVGDFVYLAGEEHLIQVLHADDLSRARVYFTGTDPASGSWALKGGGDFQDLEVVGDRVYATCHCWSQVLDPGPGGALFPTNQPASGDWYPVNTVFAITGSSGEVDPSFQLDVAGSAGVWAVHGSPDGCLWAGGDLTQSGSVWLRDLGHWCDSEGPMIDVTRPSTPRGLRLAEVTPGAIAVTWTGSEDDVGVAGYEVYRSTDGTLGGFVGFTQSTTFTDTTIAPGGTYTYGIKAADLAGNLSWRTNLVTATASDFEDTVRPTTVRGLVSSSSAETIDLAWNPSSDNVAVVGYRIYRSEDGTLGPLVDTSADASWTDSTVVAGTTYTYAVRPFDEADNVGWRSNLVTASMQP